MSPLSAHALALLLRTSSLALLSALALRSLPFVLYAALARRLGVAVRAVSFSIFALLVAGAFGAGDQGWRESIGVAEAVVWFVGSALAVHFLSVRISARAARSFVVFAVAVALYLGAPALLWHFTPPPAPPLLIKGVCVAFGWEAAMRAHSYAVSVAGFQPRPAPERALFSLLVHPHVVVPWRSPSLREAAADAPASDSAAIARIVQGAVTMLGRDFALLLLAQPLFTHWGDVAWARSPLGYLEFVATELIAAAGLYAAHSGLASFQIGWMRLFGVTVPERYRFPVLALSPQDFWNRWNTWVGEWARRYLFVPCSLAAMRALGGTLGASAGAMAAFVAIGLYHDVGLWALGWGGGRHVPTFRMTIIFTGFGVLLVVWRAVATRCQSLARPLPNVVRKGLAWVLAMQAIAWLAWLAVSVLRTQHFPQVVEGLWTSFVSRFC